MKNSIFNYTLDELGQYFESIGNKSFEPRKSLNGSIATGLRHFPK